MNLCISLPEDTKRELEADIKIDFSFSENSVGCLCYRKFWHCGSGSTGCWQLTMSKYTFKTTWERFQHFAERQWGSKACWQSCWRRVANCKAGSPEQSKLLISGTANCPHRDLLQRWLDLMTMTDSETETESRGVLCPRGLQKHNTSVK